MKLILQIAAGILLAKLIWLIGELILAGAAIGALEHVWKNPQPVTPLTIPPPPPKPTAAPTQLSMAPALPPTSKLPSYPFPINSAPAGIFACMNGIVLRKEESGWTQLDGTTQTPACVTP